MYPKVTIYVYAIFFQVRVHGNTVVGRFQVRVTRYLQIMFYCMISNHANPETVRAKYWGIIFINSTSWYCSLAHLPFAQNTQTNMRRTQSIYLFILPVWTKANCRLFQGHLGSIFGELSTHHARMPIQLTPTQSLALFRTFNAVFWQNRAICN